MNMNVWRMCLPAMVIGLFSGSVALAAEALRGGEEIKEVFIYIGTSTGPKSASKGIYVARLDLEKGTLSTPKLAVEADQPSFLALHPNGKFLYAAHETNDGAGAASFAINPADGTLKAINQKPSAGKGTCFVGVDHAGRNVLVANYGSGSVAVLPIRADGALGDATAEVQHAGSSVNPSRQTGPHAHAIYVDQADRFAFAVDLGLDKILIYRFDPARGTLEANDPAFAAVAPGAGPRHFAFHPSGKFAYVIDELANTVTAFAYDANRGSLKELQAISTLPADFQGTNYTSEIQVHPSGKFLYGANRGHDSIAAFSIDVATGQLKSIGQTPSGGKWAQNFGIDPTGRFLIVANQHSDKITVLAIDPATGALKPTNTSAEVPSPMCVRYLPVGR